MNLGEIKQNIRAIAQDVSEYSYLWSDEEIVQYVNEGQIEACRFAPWILRSSSLSLGETKSSSKLTVFGTFGTISSILVNNVNIITNPINYTSNDNTTAAIIANEINNTGLFEAELSENIITLKPLDGFGSFYNNIVPVIVSTNEFVTATAFSGGIDGICRIQLKPNVREYKFSNKILKIEAMYLGDSQKKLCAIDFRDLTDSQKAIAAQKGDVEAILYGMSNDSFYVAKIPTVKNYINLTVSYMPLKNLRLNSDIPEIPEQYHSKLIHYALYKMYQKNDIEAEQLDISSFHYSKFIEEFGDNQFAAASGKINHMFFFGG